jgi:hypothetical protein
MDFSQNKFRLAKKNNTLPDNKNDNVRAPNESKNKSKNESDPIESKQNEAEQNEAEQNESKQNESKQNESKNENTNNESNNDSKINNKEDKKSDIEKTNKKNDSRTDKSDDSKTDNLDDGSKKKKRDERIMIDKSTDTHDLQHKNMIDVPTNVHTIRTSSHYSAIQSILSDVKSTNMLEYIQILKGISSLLENKDNTNPRNLNNSRNKIMKQKRNLLQSSLKRNAPFDRNRLN